MAFLTGGASRALFGLVAATVLLFGPGPAWAQEVVRMGDLPAFSNAGLYIAMDKGYFTERGIKVETEEFASGGKMTPALATGQLDVATGASSAGLFNAIATGGGFKIVADKGQVRPGWAGTLLTVRKDLVDSGEIKSAKDLKGRTISTGAKGLATEYLLSRVLEGAGLNYDAVNMTYLSYPDGVKALASKAIDAFWAPEPWGARAEEQGVGVRFSQPDHLKSMGTFQIGIIIFSDKFMRERPKVARDFLAAYVKGARLYSERGPKDPEIVAIVSKHTKAPPETVKASFPFWIAPDGKPRTEDLLAVQDFFVERGWMKAKLPADKIIDLSFLP